MILEHIKSPDDVRALRESELKTLAEEIRNKILQTVSTNGGHLASNLCVVELTIALHRVFHSPDDKIIFDVGHQSYVHKLLTGRYDTFGSLRRHGGISGYTVRDESVHDAFGAGHSSTSISAAVGIAAANKLSGSKAYTVAVVGDGAFTGGMIYEALNNCSDKDRLIIILNDNDMSISANVGGMSRYFSRVRTSAKYFRVKNATKRFFGKIPFAGNGMIKGARAVKNGFKRMVLSQNFFEHLGISYYGPLDGNDEKHLEIVLNEAKDDGKCSVIHICTKKGKGYAPAEIHPDKFHGVNGFDIASGELVNGHCESFSERFGSLICKRAESDEHILAITASMEDGTGLTEFATRFPARFYDVGIAEQHAVTFACGLATCGYTPVFAVYSTFMQRAYDQLLHDAALQKLHIVLMIDRAGLVGSDGATHHGIFDVDFASHIPGVTMYSPLDFAELEECFDNALYRDSGPVIVRYPKCGDSNVGNAFKSVDGLKICDMGNAPKIALLTYGRITENTFEAAKASGVDVRIIKLTKLVPSDADAIVRAIDGISDIIFVEEGIKRGGIGERTGDELAERGLLAGRSYSVCAIDDVFPTHGRFDELCEDLGLSASAICKRIKQLDCKKDET